MRNIVYGAAMWIGSTLVGAIASSADAVLDWLLLSPTGNAFGLLAIFVVVVLGFRSKAHSDRYSDGI